MALVRHVRKLTRSSGNVRNFSSKADIVKTEVEEKSGVATLTLQRPPVNSLNIELLTAIKTSLNDLEKNKSRGLILTSDLKVFSAGLDVLEMYQPNQERLEQFWITLQDVWISLYGSTYPTVAVINGAAPAGGCLLAMSCEYRVMVPKSVIGLNETKLGLVAPQWFAQTMENTIGKRQTEMALTAGHMFTSEEALRIGLIDEIVQNKEEGVEKALGFMNKFSQISQMARSMSKQTIRGNALDQLIKNRDKDLKEFLGTVNQEQVQKGLGIYIKMLKNKSA